MISLSDEQLQTVMAAAGSIDPDRRPVFLERVGSMLRLRGRYSSNDDVAEISKLALCGLVHSPADTAA
jgi:hypothetical protein